VSPVRGYERQRQALPGCFKRLSGVHPASSDGKCFCYAQQASTRGAAGSSAVVSSWDFSLMSYNVLAAGLVSHLPKCFARSRTDGVGSFNLLPQCNDTCTCDCSAYVVSCVCAVSKHRADRLQPSLSSFSHELQLLNAWDRKILSISQSP
jgi:hypothetical protein